MPYRRAGIDVHKRMLAIAVSDVEVDGEYPFERREFGSNLAQLRLLAEWLIEQQVEEAVMESTAQYGKPVWGALERYWKPMAQRHQGAGSSSGTLHLAQAQSNRARWGRKKDFADAERLVKRLVAKELTLSFVPDAEQRLWRTVTRAKYQLTRSCNAPQSFPWIFSRKFRRVSQIPSRLPGPWTPVVWRDRILGCIGKKRSIPLAPFPLGAQSQNGPRRQGFLRRALRRALDRCGPF